MGAPDQYIDNVAWWYKLAFLAIAFIAMRVAFPQFTQNTLQKAREILDELRRRAGERFRPEIELDYIERLLKRF